VLRHLQALRNVVKHAVRDFVVHGVEHELGSLLEDELSARRVRDGAFHDRQRHPIGG